MNLNSKVENDNEKLPFEALFRINVNHDLDEKMAQDSLETILNISNPEVRLTLLSMLLYGIMVKKPKIDEVVGLIKAALSLDKVFDLRKSKAIVPNGEKIIGYAGSGKKGVKTINISTPAAIVAASCGAFIAKACSHSTSSLTGSSDFLENIGVDLDVSIEKNLELLQRLKLSFFSIEKTTPKFAQIYGGRFFAPHALSFALAALSLPIEVDFLLYGIAHPNIKLSIEVLKHFNIKNAMVLTSTEDGLHYIDEVGISGTLSIVELRDGSIGRVEMFPIAKEFEFDKNYSMADIKQHNNPRENIKTAIQALSGKGKKSYIDLISVNAGLLLYLAQKVDSLKEGYMLAKENIYNGRSFEKLVEIVELTHERGVPSISKLKEFYLYRSN